MSESLQEAPKVCDFSPRLGWTVIPSLKAGNGTLRDPALSTPRL